MNFHRSPFAGLDRAVWVAIGAVAATDLALAFLTSFDIAWRSFAWSTLLCAVLAVIGRYYRQVRRDAQLAAALTATAQLFGFAAVAAPLSYLAASANLPLWDATLAAWDRDLGCDWVRWLGFVTATPWLHAILSAAYASFSLQAITTVLALTWLGQGLRLQMFIAAVVATTLATIGLSAIFPAAGTWLHYGIDAAAAHGYAPASHTSWPVFLGLRDGSVHMLTAAGSEVIITFPSLHAALGVLFIAALWPIRGLRWIALVLNLAMIAATPAEGSHHIVDVVAGTALAAAIWCATWYFLAATQHAVAPADVVDAPSIVPDPSSTGISGTQPADLAGVH